MLSLNDSESVGAAPDIGFGIGGPGGSSGSILPPPPVPLPGGGRPSKDAAAKMHLAGLFSDALCKLCMQKPKVGKSAYDKDIVYRSEGAGVAKSKVWMVTTLGSSNHRDALCFIVRSRAGHASGES